MTIETPAATNDFEVLRILIDLRENVLQKQRIALGNRLSAIERGADVVDENTYRIISRFFTSFERLESDADEEIKALVKRLPIVKAMTEVKGIGPMLAARVVSMIDITLVDHVSALWKWAGYSVTDGVADKPRKGESISYNPRLKATIRLAGQSFLKSNSPYRGLYDYWKAEYIQRSERAKILIDEQKTRLNQLQSRLDTLAVAFGDHYTDAGIQRLEAEFESLQQSIKETEKQIRTPLHIHNMAMRKMEKIWLSHLWAVWREMEGLPVVDAYVHQHLKHTTRITPQEMGWK